MKRGRKRRGLLNVQGIHVKIFGKVVKRERERTQKALKEKLTALTLKGCFHPSTS